jgi:O-antigen/teichoic acid export membrane protein
LPSAEEILSTSGSAIQDPENPVEQPSGLEPPPRKGLRRYFDVGFLKSFLTRNGDRGLERYRRAGITASTSFLSKALTIIISFASVPLTVHYLGAERYGVWLTISSLLTWMSLTDFGIAGNALVNVIAEADGKDDRQMAREYAASAFWTLCFASTTVGIVMAFLFPQIPWRSVFRVSSVMSTQELHLACGLTLLLFALSMPLNMLNSIYSAYQDGFVANMWGIASNVLALVALLVVTHLQGGLPALIVALSGTRVMVSTANAFYLFTNRYRWLRPALSAIRWTRVRRLFQLGGKYMVTQMASLGIYQSQPFIITQLLGPAKVATFLIAYKIITVPVDLSYIATTPFVSAFTEAKARADWKWITGAFKNASLACLAVGIPVTVGIALTGKVLVRLLAGSQVVPDWSVIAWLSAYTLIGISAMTMGQLLCGLDRVGGLAVALSLSAVATIGLGILFAHWWGLAGIAAGMAVAKVITYLPIQSHQVWGILRYASAQKSETGMSEV